MMQCTLLGKPKEQNTLNNFMKQLLFNIGQGRFAISAAMYVAANVGEFTQAQIRNLQNQVQWF